MGINGLYKYIETKHPECVTCVDVAELATKHGIKRVAVDTSISAHKFYYAGCIFSGFMRQILAFRKAGVLPIYILDGCPPEAKAETLSDRENVYENTVHERDAVEVEVELLSKGLKDGKLPSGVGVLEAASKLKSLKEQLVKLNQRVSKPTTKHFKLLRDLFDLLGVCYVSSNSESEWLCCDLANNGYVDAVYSDDSDVFLNLTGSSTTGSSVGLTKRSGKVLSKWDLRDNSINIYDVEIILESIGLTHEQLVDVGIMSGCDYTPGINGIGIVKAVNLVKKYSNIEGVIQKAGIAIDDEFLGKYQDARDLFNSFPDDLGMLNINTQGGYFDPNINESGEIIGFGYSEIDEEGVREFLSDNTRMSQKTINGLITEMKKCAAPMVSEIKEPGEEVSETVVGEAS